MDSQRALKGGFYILYGDGNGDRAETNKDGERC